MTDEQKDVMVFFAIKWGAESPSDVVARCSPHLDHAEVSAIVGRLVERNYVAQICDRHGLRLIVGRENW